MTKCVVVDQFNCIVREGFSLEGLLELKSE